MRIPGSMKTGHTFSQVPSASIPRSSFQRSHNIKTTFDAGKLIPFLVDEILPGDTYVVSLTALARLATPIKPIMDNLYLDTFFFFVPYRLVWENWQRFMGEQNTPGASTDYVVPMMQPPAEGYSTGDLQDYMGIPLGVANNPSDTWRHSTLPIRAYYRIWNEWFRDQNLQGPAGLGLEIGDGPDVADPNSVAVLNRGKRHDYFTSCLPWPQKGDVATLPIGNTAPVIADGVGYPLLRNPAQGMINPLNIYSGGVKTGSTYDLNIQAGQDPTTAQLAWHTTGLVADLGSAQSITINQLRQAFQIQKLMERDARGGTRYTEILRAHFGVISPDARLQRPEYLGGGSTPIQVSPVAQTSGSAGDAGYTDTPQGNLSAIGTGAIHGHGFAKSFTEHGVLLGLVSARADLTYQQGLDRMWSRSTKYDFYWPALAQIGEQSVLNQEIFLMNDRVENVKAFGYQERYAEYRYFPSKVTGRFRSVSGATLDIWHLAQRFTELPTLNDPFIQENPPLDRVIAVQDEPHFLFDGYVQMKCARPMPVFGVPGMIDHF